MSSRFLKLGDTALTLELGTRIDPDMTRLVAALDQRLQHKMRAGALVGVIETVPAYCSLTVIFDPLVLPRQTLETFLRSLLEEKSKQAEFTNRLWRLPVCYDPEYGPDLEAVAAAKGLAPEEVVALHTERPYLVYMIGFLPGFPYMGELDPALEMPRRTEPRVRVPVGSVAITGRQTAIYPWTSPGGWQLIGCCPLPLFDAERSEPALLAQGDQVIFEAISSNQFRRLRAAAKDKSLRYSEFMFEEKNP